MRVVTLSAGMGNVRSVVRALERAAPSPKDLVITADADEVRRADVLVVPGQGSFGTFSAALDDELRAVIVSRIQSGMPYLGICLGLQILFEESEEAPGARGLGVLRGRVRRLQPEIRGTEGQPLALPHMGWNRADVPLDAGGSGADVLVSPAHYYFAHTYVAEPEDPSVVIATTTYGETFASAVAKENVVGVQFHPEKSQRAGLLLLERFFATVARARI